MKTFKQIMEGCMPSQKEVDFGKIILALEDATDEEISNIIDSLSEEALEQFNEFVESDITIEEAVDYVKKDKEGKVVSWKHIGDWKKNNPKKKPEGVAPHLSDVARRKSEKMSNEEVENLDELSKDTLKSYTKKAVGDFQRQSMKSNDNAKQQALNRYKGIHKAVDKLAKEEVEQGVAEASNAMQRYGQKILKQVKELRAKEAAEAREKAEKEKAEKEKKQGVAEGTLEEGAVKQLEMDLTELSDKEFEAKYHQTKAEARKGMGMQEGWEEMIKARKEREAAEASKSNGGEGVKKGSRYGGSKQDDEKQEKSKKESVDLEPHSIKVSSNLEVDSIANFITNNKV